MTINFAMLRPHQSWTGELETVLEGIVARVSQWEKMSYIDTEGGKKEPPEELGSFRTIQITSNIKI